MVNLVRPRGFVASRMLSGAAWSGGVNMYWIPSTDTNQYNPGDAVKSVANADGNGLPAVTKALGTDTVRGVIVGCLRQTPNNTSLVGTNLDLTVQNIPATKLQAYYVLVVDDPDVLFELQDDGLAALTATASNKNASFTVTNPTAPAQNSASVLSTASVATTITLPLKLMGLKQSPDNAFGVNAVWIVKFNQHELMGGTAGV